MTKVDGPGFPFKTSKCGEAQIAFLLRQAELGTVVGAMCRKSGISQVFRVARSWHPEGSLTRTKLAGNLNAFASRQI